MKDIKAKHHTQKLLAQYSNGLHFPQSIPSTVTEERFQKKKNTNMLRVSNDERSVETFPAAFASESEINQSEPYVQMFKYVVRHNKLDPVVLSYIVLFF